MKKIIVFLLGIILVSCSNSTGYKKKINVDCSDCKPHEFEIKQYNNALFSLDTANFAEELKKLHHEFPELIPSILDDGQISYMKDFVTDTFCLRINKMVEEAFPDISAVEDEVKSVYRHFNYYFPDVPVLPTYTYVSGIDMATGPVLVAPDYVMISLDYYLSNKDLVYDYVGMPRFISVRCQPASLPKDVANALYDKYLHQNILAKDALSEMIERGKMYYFIEAMVPSVADSVLLGYSSRQMQWAQDNEGQVWASVVGNKMLYSNNLDIRRTLFGEAPFTAAFSNDAPARLGDFIGLQIVRSFMSVNEISLTTMLKMTDEQEIFQRSEYKPAKR